MAEAHPHIRAVHIPPEEGGRGKAARDHASLAAIKATLQSIETEAAGGKQLGSPAGRSHGHTELTVTLQPNQTAHVVLQIADVSNFPRAACRPATASALRVYAPGNYAAMKIPFSFRACARKGPVYLHVSTAISGTGIPGYTG